MTADSLGGVWSYALEVIEGLQQRRIEVVLATMGAPLSAAQRDQLAGFPQVICCESAYRLEWMDDPWEEVDQAGEWLLSLARKFQPEVIHLNGFTHGALPWNAPVLIVAHSCVLSWWKAVKGTPPPERYAEYQERVAGGLNAASLVVAPTAAMLMALHKHYALKAPACVISNGRNAAPFQPGEKEHVIFSAGRLWDEAKNIALLEAIAPRLSWPVRVAGERCSPGQESPRQHFTNVQSLGALPAGALAAELARASIYAAPARYEPFGLTVLEAAMAGCALVLSDVPSLRETWKGAAIFLSPDEPEAWRRTLDALIRDAQRRSTLGALARLRAQAFSADAMVQRYLVAYAGLRGRGAPQTEEAAAA